MLLKSILAAIISVAVYMAATLTLSKWLDPGGDTSWWSNYKLLLLLIALPLFLVSVIVVLVLNAAMWWLHRQQSMGVQRERYLLYCLLFIIVVFGGYMIHDYNERAAYFKEAGILAILKEYLSFVPLAVLLFWLNAWWAWNYFKASTVPNDRIR
jgi:hypothetical protein